MPLVANELQAWQRRPGPEGRSRLSASSRFEALGFATELSDKEIAALDSRVTQQWRTSDVGRPPARRAVALRTCAHGARHVEVVLTLINLAVTLSDEGEHAAALASC